MPAGRVRSITSIASVAAVLPSCAEVVLTPPAVLQRSTADRADLAVELASGHHPFLSMPGAVADLVLSL